MITLCLHGGAGNITPAMMNQEQEDHYRRGLNEALEKGYGILSQGGSAMDAVVGTIVELENNPLFNAGRGSVFTKKRIA